MLVSEVVLCAIAAVLVAAAASATWDPLLSVAGAAAGVAVLGVGASVARGRQAARVPVGASGEELVDNYRARFYVQMTMCNLVLAFAVLGGLGALAAPFLVGLIVCAINLVLAAPHGARVAADQELLASVGTRVDLTALLRSGGAEGFGGGRGGPGGAGGSGRGGPGRGGRRGSGKGGSGKGGSPKGRR